jgi:hypothetical protein
VTGQPAASGAFPKTAFLPPRTQISNREPRRRVRADDSARRNDEVIRLTQRKETIRHRSNREPLRLETDVTQTKQITGHHSNREKEAWLSDHDQPVPHPNPRISNREPLRRVRADDSARRNDEAIHVTLTKQTTGHRCNREKEAWLSDHDEPVPHPNPRISNREPLRLETDVTLTKQTTGHRSNREKEAGFRTGSGMSIVSAIAEQLIQPGEIMDDAPISSRRDAFSNARKAQADSKNSTRLPSFLLRLRTTSFLCFVGVTKNFNLTVLRLKQLAKRSNRKTRTAEKEGHRQESERIAK